MPRRSRTSDPAWPRRERIQRWIARRADEGLETLSNSELGELYTSSMFAEDEVQVTVAIIDDGDADEAAEMNVTVMRPSA